MKNFFLVLLLIGSVLTGFAQQSDREFAEYYYKNKEFDKAQLYFEKLYEQQAVSYYYTRLLSCYEQQESFDKAIDLIKDYIKSSKDPGPAYFDLGLLYNQQKEEKKAQKYFEKGLDELPMNRGTVSSIGKKLENASLFDLAKALYSKARESNTGYGFNLELANLYGVQGETQEMVRSYIGLVEENSAYLNSVESAFMRYLNFTEDEEQADLLRENLLEAVQKNPKNKTLAELLIWFYYQKKDFAPAFAQIKAIDLRFAEGGTRILQFAQLAARNNDYRVAYRAYDYLIEAYPEDQLRTQAVMQKAKMAYLRLQEISIPSDADKMQVMEAFTSAIDELGKQENTASLLIDYADYTLKFGAGPEAAKQMLEEVIALPNLYNRVQALAKLRLADIKLIIGEIWEAALLYGQVDKAFKEDELGSEAKLRNAKIAFYTGDFEWAQAQLDVLKNATSELISNDAMDLSLLITNNFNLDTVTEPLELYAAADLAVVQNQFENAHQLLDSLNNKYPGHSLADEILWTKYKIAMKKENFEAAATFLQEILSTHPFDLLGDNALFQLAMLNLEYLGNREKAAELFEKLLLDYPGSLFVIEARKQFRRLRGDIYFEG